MDFGAGARRRYIGVVPSCEPERGYTTAMQMPRREIDGEPDAYRTFRLASPDRPEVPCADPGNRSARRRRGPTIATKTGAATSHAAAHGRAHARPPAARSGTRNLEPWNTRTECSSMPRTRRKLGSWCFATAA